VWLVMMQNEDGAWNTRASEENVCFTSRRLARRNFVQLRRQHPSRRFRVVSAQICWDI